MPCARCDDQGWVCEKHPKLPWDGTSARSDACKCGGAGMPCEVCYPHPQCPPDSLTFKTMCGAIN